QKSPSFLGAGHTVDTIALSLIRGAKPEAQHVLTSAQGFWAQGCQTTHSSRAVLQSCSLCHQAHILGAGLVYVALVVTAHFDVHGRWVSQSPGISSKLTLRDQTRKGEAEFLQILLEALRPWEKMPEPLGEVHAGHSSSDIGFGCPFLEAWPWLKPSSRCACPVAWPIALQPRPCWEQPKGFCIRGHTRLSYGETCACHPAAPSSTGSGPRAPRARAGQCGQQPGAQWRWRLLSAGQGRSAP
ncbi:hypothetical protein K5549_019420, partial [Capra hircus]